MATTFTAAQAARTFPVRAPVGAGILCAAIGSIAVAANPTANDIYEMCWIPAGATIVGGEVRAADIDTGTEALDMDLGWAANGGSGTYDTADPDGLGNFGVWNGDAFATGNFSIVAGNVMTFAGAYLGVGVYPGPFSFKTLIQFVCNVTANAFTAGQLSVKVEYQMP